jgi:hypothetical protein
MWRSAFLSITSLVVACSDGSPATCGAGSAATSIDVVAGSVTLTYDMLQSGANNDCPAPMAPTGVVSVTIARPSPPLFTLCVGRPDKLGEGLPLGTGVKVIDVSGSGGGCTYALDSTTPPTGTAKSSGLCKNGSDPAGFALTLDGTISLKRTCGGTTDTVSATVSGTVAIPPQ